MVALATPGRPASVKLLERVLNPREIRHLWKHEPVDRLPMVVTFAGTVTLSLEWAILLGLATAWVSRRLAGPETGSGSL